MTVRILTGDCREVLATLPAESVHCVVTSPPYWGLRDYGTAKWEGVNPDCDHVAGTLVSLRSTLRSDGREHTGPYPREKALMTGMPYRDICGKCGAIRIDSQLGLEPTPEAHVEAIVAVFREVRRVLRKDGTVWLNYGDCYASDMKGSGGPGGFVYRAKGGGGNAQAFEPRRLNHGLKPKDLVMMPARVALALQADGWWLRSEIIWAKPNPMPESVTDRPTSAHEKVYLLAKSARYFYDPEAVREEAEYGFSLTPEMFNGIGDCNSAPVRKHGAVQQGSGGSRNLRNVWTIATHPYSEAHFATFPPDLVIPCIKAGTSERGCCPKCGAGWRRGTERTGHVNGREPAHVPSNSATKTDSTGWAPTSRATDRWPPSCACDAGAPIPCTVLDPFGGAGTVGLVADQLQRDAVLIELNPAYAEMARARIHNDAPLFADADPDPAYDWRENTRGCYDLAIAEQRRDLLARNPASQEATQDRGEGEG